MAERCPGQVRWFAASPEAGRKGKGAFLRGDSLITRDTSERPICHRQDLLLPGDHNVLNALAAAAISRCCGADVAAIREVVTTFRGVPHRLQLIRSLGGVNYYNDSIATSPERTVAALRAIDRPIVLIAGGRSKHLALDTMARLVGSQCRALITLGEMAGEIEEAVKLENPGRRLTVERAADLADAVRRARKLARAGDAVLLSPAGTALICSATSKSAVGDSWKRWRG